MAPLGRSNFLYQFHNGIDQMPVLRTGGVTSNNKKDSPQGEESTPFVSTQFLDIEKFYKSTTSLSQTS